MKRGDFQLGAVAAAEVAETYNSTSTHPYRLGDCILAKMNIGKQRPRVNVRRLRRDRDGRVGGGASLDLPIRDAWVRGFAVALAEMHRLLLSGNDSTGVCKVAREAGVTLKVARSAGVSNLDLKELKKAGVR